MLTNLQIERTNKQLTEVLNNSGLPVGVAYYLLKSILMELESLYYKSIELENAEYIDNNSQEEKTNIINFDVTDKNPTVEEIHFV